MLEHVLLDGVCSGGRSCRAHPVDNDEHMFDTRAMGPPPHAALPSRSPGLLPTELAATNTIMPTRSLTLAAERTLPVASALGGLLPTGLPRGVTVTITGSAARSFTWALASEASQAGAWCAVIGLTGLGWQALTELGVAPHRVVTITADDAAQQASAIAAAVDGFDLIIVGNQTRLRTDTQRRLAARARERGTVLIGVHESSHNDQQASNVGVFGPISDLRATTKPEPWTGLGVGSGRLASRAVHVNMEGKRLPGRQRSARLWLPGPNGQLANATVSTRAPDPPLATTTPTNNAGLRSA